MVVHPWWEMCATCGRVWGLDALRWVCACGGLLDLIGPRSDPVASDRRPADRYRSPLARYAPALPPGSGRVDLGLTVTPLLEVGRGTFVKCEFEQPTGSFKDRGAAVMIGAAAELGVTSVVVDSSGNAGKAAAAHAAAAGLRCTVYVPAGTAPAKLEAITGYGARVLEVPGGRTETAAAAQAALGTGSEHPWYASHVHQPVFHHGVKTLAFELWEQLTRPPRGTDRGRPVEDATVVVPAGNGTLVLGLWLGFSELVAAGHLRRPPALVAVQSERCAPLAGRRVDPAGPTTAAAGIAIPAPARAAQVRGAVLATGGRLVTVGEGEIEGAREHLDQLGWAVEPTAAVAWAAADRLTGHRGGPVVALLTGR